MTRNSWRARRTFGPLTYVSLAVATVAIPIGIALRIAERVHLSEAVPAAIMNPDDQLASIVVALEKGDPPARAGAIASLSDFAFIHGRAPQAAKARARAVSALIELSKSADVSERAAAAEALGQFAPDEPAAILGLTALLQDNDPTVRFAAASALIRLAKNTDAHAQALRALTEMAEDEVVADRDAVLAALWNSGAPGEEVVLKTLRRLLSSKDALDRTEGIRSAAALQVGLDRLLKALAPLLTSGRPDARWAAAVAVMDASGREEKAPDPAVISALEGAAMDTTLSLDQRMASVVALTQSGSGMAGPMGMAGGMGMAGVSGSGPPWAWPALRRCGLELARQLDHKDRKVRIAAATLLHMIDPDALAGKDLPKANASDAISDLEQ